MKKDTVGVGDIFGNWTVIAERPLSRGMARKFLCECKCGNRKEVYYSHLKYGSSKSCGCLHPRKSTHYKWTGYKEITGTHWRSILYNANGKKKRAAIPVEITIQDAWQLFEKQDRRCALTGIELKFGKERTASLDRIDSNKGYIKDNIQWIHKDINRMKNIFSNTYFIWACKKVSSHCK